jgi:hypothetical protein
MPPTPAERAARREVIHEITRILDDIDVPLYDAVFGDNVGVTRLCDVADTSQLASMILNTMQADPITRPALRLVVG